MKDFLSETDAADYLELSPNTLRNWRSQKKGPAYIKLGRDIRYQQEDLDKFIEQKKVKPMVATG